MIFKQKIILGFCVSILIGMVGFFASSGFIFAQDNADESLISNINKQIAEQRKKIDELADKIEAQKDKINETQKKAATLRSQMSILDNQIAKTLLDIQAKQEEIKTTELEIEKIELEMEESTNKVTKNKDQLSAFIRQMNVYDEKSYLSVLLGNESFSDFFDQIKSLEGVEKGLQNTLNRTQELLIKLEIQKQESDKKRDSLSELLNRLEQENLSLQDQRGTKTYLITETQNSEARFQKLVGNLKQEQINVNAQVASLERKLREELSKRGEAERFNNFGSAALAWPTSVRWITAYFHDPDYPYRYLFEHSGIDLGTPNGTPLRAAEAGYVARVSHGTRWYGNYIMVIHNNNLSTLYAHLSSINVKADQYVAKGQVIGATGNSGFSSGPHLHFEVRYNGIPVNPLNYLP